MAVFDIDGTLTDTMEVDVACYEAAVREILGVEIPADWPDFDEVTDTAIVERACELRGVPQPDEDAMRRMEARVGELLEEAFRAEPDRFQPIPGARDVFERLQERGWAVAMATGAWRPSALVKLRGAALRWHGVPLATSSERRARADIIRHAVRLGGRHDASTVVYVGDGVWDGRAATTLGYAFVGVGDGDHAARLDDAGALAVVPDLTWEAGLVDALERIAGR